MAFNALKPNAVQHSQTFATKPKKLESIFSREDVMELATERAKYIPAVENEDN